MRVNCPNCTAGYEVPDRLLAAGPRTLRCARCGTTFQAGIAVAEDTAAPPESIASPVASPVASPGSSPGADLTPSPVGIPPPPMADAFRAEPTPLAYPRAAPVAAERRLGSLPAAARAQFSPAGGSGALLGAAGWLLTVALLAAGGFAAVQHRSGIVAVWPASARIYDAVGLNPAAAGPPRPAATAGP